MSQTRYGFTLIELIVVMAMVTVIMAVAAPRLGRFFQGQSIGEEVRRFLAVLEYARNEAVSSAVPIDLYMDTSTGEYGILAAAGYEIDENKKRSFQLGEGLSFELFQQENLKYRDGVMHIVYLPDGFLDDISVRAFKILHETDVGQNRVIAQSNIGIDYQILPDGEQGARDFYDTLKRQRINP